MGEKRTFNCCGSTICLFDGGASVKFRDGTVQIYDNPREGIIAFANSVSGYIVKRYDYICVPAVDTENAPETD